MYFSGSSEDKTQCTNGNILIESKFYPTKKKVWHAHTLKTYLRLKIWIQDLNKENLVISKTIGINLWLEPQISLHWPKNSPTWPPYIFKKFIRPGTASTFKPRDGIAQACRTSEAQTPRRILDCTGKIIRLSVSKRRNPPSERFWTGIIKESNEILLKSK